MLQVHPLDQICIEYNRVKVSQMKLNYQKHSHQCFLYELQFQPIINRRYAYPILGIQYSKKIIKNTILQVHPPVCIRFPYEIKTDDTQLPKTSTQMFFVYRATLPISRTYLITQSR